MIKVFVLIMQLTNGELAKVPVSLAIQQATCNDAFNKKVLSLMPGDDIMWKGVPVGAYYCKSGTGGYIN